MTPITAILAFTVKHFICDFPLQAHPWIYRNKGRYGHPGGLVHAIIHALGTFIILDFFSGLVDGIFHYHIDWAKMNIGKRFNLKPDNSEWFWILLGFDQLLHMLTYFALAQIAIGDWSWG